MGCFVYLTFARNYVFLSDCGKLRERRQLDGVGIDEMITKAHLGESGYEYMN
jgi:hypothetical protein